MSVTSLQKGPTILNNFSSLLYAHDHFAFFWMPIQIHGPLFPQKQSFVIAGATTKNAKLQLPLPHESIH